jgi:hypothetical protein
MEYSALTFVNSPPKPLCTVCRGRGTVGDDRQMTSPYVRR